MASEWPEIQIGELVRRGEVTLQTGPFGSQLHKHDYIEYGVPVVPTEAIGRGLILSESVLPQITEKKATELKRHALQRGDILFARRGAQATGLSAHVDDDHAGALCGTGAILLRLRSSTLDSKFLASFLATNEAFEWLRTHAVGAVMPNLNTGIISKLAVPVPPLAVQIEIASFISAIECRIQLLKNKDATLEAIAQALFKSWFVDFDPVRAKAEGREPDGMDAATAALFPDSFEDSPLGSIPQGWHAGSLGAVSSNPRKQAKPEQIDPATPYFGLEHLPRKSIALGDHGIAQGLASGKFWFERLDILFGKLRPYFHKVGLAPSRGICSTDILVLRPSSAAFHGFLLMHASSNALIDYATRLSNGAKMPRSSWKDVSSYPVPIPPDPLGDAFNRYVEPLFERILANIDTSRSLSALRDTLLPRLICGKLRLPDAQTLLEETTP